GHAVPRGDEAIASRRHLQAHRCAGRSGRDRGFLQQDRWNSAVVSHGEAGNVNDQGHGGVLWVGMKKNKKRKCGLPLRVDLTYEHDLIVWASECRRRSLSL